MTTLLISVAGSTLASDPLPCNDAKITNIVMGILDNNYNESIKTSGVKTTELVELTTSMAQVTGFNKPLRKRSCQLLLNVTPLPAKVNSTWSYIKYAIDHSVASGVPDMIMPRYYPEVYSLFALEESVSSNYLKPKDFHINYNIQIKEGSSSDFIVSAALDGPYGMLKLMAAGEKFHRNGGK
jgi:hypothetical protein